MCLDNFLLSQLELTSVEVDYLRTLKGGRGFEDLNLLKSGYKSGDAVIKEYVSEVLDERIYSSRLF